MRLFEKELNQELTTDELKDVAGGLEGVGKTTPYVGENCQDNMGQAKAMRKIQKRLDFCEQSDE